MKYEDISIGTQVLDVQSQREMTVTELHSDDQTVSCSHVDGSGAVARVPPASLELLRDGGMMDNV